MKSEMLCESYLKLDDIDNVRNVPVKKLDTLVRKICDRRHYHLDGHDYKFPGYYKRLIFYVKKYDSFKNKNVLVASELQKMVSKTLQTRIREDFTGKLVEMAAYYNVGEDYEAMSRVAKNVCASEQVSREERAAFILEVNLAAARKSRF